MIKSLLLDSYMNVSHSQNPNGIKSRSHRHHHFQHIPEKICHLPRANDLPQIVTLSFITTYSLTYWLICFDFELRHADLNTQFKYQFVFFSITCIKFRTSPSQCHITLYISLKSFLSGICSVNKLL